MKIEELLKVQNTITLAETTYENNTHPTKSLNFLKNIASDLSQFNEPVRAKILLIEDNDSTVYATAFYNPPQDTEAHWTLFTAILDPNSQDNFKHLINTIKNHIIEEEITTTQVEKQQFIKAMQEYYTAKLLESSKDHPVNPEFVYNKPRVERVKTIIRQLEKSHKLNLSGRVLEICCGNGMATAALHELEIQPLCIDNDTFSIIEGLKSHVLKPDETILADATELTHLLPGHEFDAAIGFMLGDIDDFNKPMWEEILIQTLKLTRKGASILFTLRTKPEAQFIKDTLKKIATGEILCPDDKESLYDRWVYIGQKD